MWKKTYPRSLLDQLNRPLILWERTQAQKMNKYVFSFSFRVCVCPLRLVIYMLNVNISKVAYWKECYVRSVGVGGAERVTHINSPPPLPPPRFGPLVIAYFVVHVGSLHLSTIPFVLVSNFPFVLTLTKWRTCLGYRSRKICQTTAFGFLSPRRSH